MFGAIIGDVCGSRYEWNNLREEPKELLGFGCRPTDDTVLTLATYGYLTDSLEHRIANSYEGYLKEFYRLTPSVGYGPMFSEWARGSRAAPNSCGNGAAMRISPIASRHLKLEDALKLAEELTLVSHNHPEAVKGAQAIVMAMHLCKNKNDNVLEQLSDRFGYSFNFKLEDLRRSYEFDATCQGSVPQAIWVAMQATSFEDAIRKAISIGGDSDTIACMAGAVAESRFGIPLQLGRDVAEIIRYSLPAELARYCKKIAVEELTLGGTWLAGGM